MSEKKNSSIYKKATGSVNSILAREICRRGSFEEAYKTLKKLSLLEKEIILTQKILKDDIHKLYPLSKKDLEMLTIIRLFDHKTFIHSIETYVTAKKKMARPLEGGVTFAEMIEQNGLTLKQFSRACLFHDIGKIAIPKFLLDSSYTDENWAQAFSQLSNSKINALIKKYSIEIPSDLLKDPEMLMEYMIRNRIRGAKFVPIKSLFSKNHTLELELKGFSKNMSLIDIMQKHEKESGKILDFMGYPKEARVAELHHNYEIAKHNENKSINACLINKKNVAADVIHIADIHEALKSNRPYLMQRPILKTLAFIVDHAKKGLIDCSSAYLWISDEMQKIDKKYLDLVMHHSNDESGYEILRDRKNELEMIQEFLAQSRKNCLTK